MLSAAWYCPPRVVGAPVLWILNGHEPGVPGGGEYVPARFPAPNLPPDRGGFVSTVLIHISIIQFTLAPTSFPQSTQGEVPPKHQDFV